MGKLRPGILKLFKDESGALKAKFIRKNVNKDIIIDWLLEPEKYSKYDETQIVAEITSGKVASITFPNGDRIFPPVVSPIKKNEPRNTTLTVRKNLRHGLDEPDFHIDDYVLKKRPSRPTPTNIHPDGRRMPIPNDTKESLKSQQPDNFHLQFYKFPVYSQPKEVPEFSLFRMEEVDKDKIEIFQIPDQLGSPAYSSILQSIKSRQQNICQSTSAYVWQSFPLTLVKPLIMGLGTPSVYENGIQLHHLYGIPYLAGSAIKGLTRAWLEKKIGTDRINNHQAIIDQLLGDQSKMGSFTFLDSFPDLNPLIEYDIINVHFPNYFNQEETPPTDNQSPNPISLPRVAVTDHSGKKPQEFTFHIGRIRAREIDLKLLQALAQVLEMPIPPNSIAFIQSVMQAALREMGIGAKTALGYGRMIN